MLYSAHNRDFNSGARAFRASPWSGQGAFGVGVQDRLSGRTRGVQRGLSERARFLQRRARFLFANFVHFHHSSRPRQHGQAFGVGKGIQSRHRTE